MLQDGTWASILGPSDDVWSGTTLLGNESWLLHVLQCNLDGKGMYKQPPVGARGGVQLVDPAQVREIE